MRQSRTTVFLSLLFVFLSGALVGTLGYRYYAINSASSNFSGPRGSRDPAEIKKRIMAEMTDALKLDPPQIEELSKIFDNTRQQFDEKHHEWNRQSHEIWQGQIDKVNSILRPEQRPLYTALREKHEKEREERNKRKQRGIQQDTSKK